VPEFISLHNHTNFSILNALSSPKELFVRAKELGQSAIGITDYGSLASVWDSLKASRETGVKLIIGCESYFLDDVANKEVKLRFVVLIAKNAIGYKNLLLLNRDGFNNSSTIGKRVFPVIDWSLLNKYKEGLICLTGCGNGIVGQLLNNKKFEEAENTLLKLADIFGDDLGVEVQTHNLNRPATYYTDAVNQVFTNQHLIRLAEKHNLRIVPTTNSFYLKKEDAEIHDVMLAIGSMQPIYSNARIKYDVPDFYVKSYDEVKAFFSRRYSVEFAEKICANTVYLANKCENADWIDPKFSNPLAKELPVFPVEKEPDYENFKNWLLKRKQFQSFDIDKAYLRFRCGIEFNKKIPANKQDEYMRRLIEEFDVIEYHGFSSYMLIVADYINWARKNGVRTGAGRGCLIGETPVLTTKGFKELKSLTTDDEVYSHTGNVRKILNKFEYDVSNEELLKIKTEHSFNDIVLTQDHKVYAHKSQETPAYKKARAKNSKYCPTKWISPQTPVWIESSELSKNDLIWTTFPNRIFDNQNVPTSLTVKYSSTHNRNLDKQVIVPIDDEFMYLIGQFVGDGCLADSDHLTKNGKKPDGYVLKISFNSSDLDGINRRKEYFSNLGLHVCKSFNKKKTKTDIRIHNKSLVQFFREIIPDYTNVADTKHLPIWFRDCNDNQLTQIIKGYKSADGYRKKYRKNQLSITSTSLRLILEVKEALLYLKTKSSIETRKAYDRDFGKYISHCKQSYQINYLESDFNNPSDQGGYYSKILNITPANDKFVYDITVDQDHSYLTSNYIVHNSVGGSLIAYLLDIHAADPIKYNLIFARFQNKDRTQHPDIDSDFCPSGRSKVQNYIRQKYGDDNVAHVSNINTITPKVYARDIARSCDLANDRELSVRLGNDIADSIPKKINEKEIKTYEEAIEKSPLFAAFNSTYPKLEKMSSICGKYRAFSTHAGGIVISNRPFSGFIPLRKDKDGAIAIEFDKEKAEEAGLVKMDTLGLETLDIIDETYKLIKAAGKQTPPDPPDFDEYDEKTYNLISKGDTFCVFQLGMSSGTIDLCKRIKPKTIEDISHINALARPSARSIRDGFIAVKDGKEKIDLLHPSLKRSFGETFGFGLYEESLMYLAQDVAGWSLNEADRLRKLTKEKGKNPKKAMEWRSEFISDAKKNKNIDEKISMEIWDEVVEKFVGYGFNKSHSILYSMISYHTAYLKAHFPVEFLLAHLMSEIRSNVKAAEQNIEKIKLEIRRNGIKINPPNLNTSTITYEIQPDGSLLTGLEALKSVGHDAINDIVAKRPFTDFDDFMNRVDKRKVRSTTIQSLAASGCFDQFNLSRKQIYLYCSDYKKKLQVWSKKHDPTKEKFQYPWPIEKDWTISELYALEKSILGEAFICNKTKAYTGFFNERSTPVRNIKQMKDRDQVKSIYAEVKSIFELKVKKEGSKYLGELMLKATVEDAAGDQISLTIFPKQWKNAKARMRELCGNKYKFEPGIAIHFSGSVNIYEDEIGIVLENLFDFAPPPPLPKDRGSKRVMKTDVVINKDLEKIDISLNTDEFILSAEDSLYDEGLIDLNAEDDD
jgi:DNA polymerase III alpha subunit/intein/homing endonuclease